MSQPRKSKGGAPKREGIKSRSLSYPPSQSGARSELKEASITRAGQGLDELYTAEEADFVNRVVVSAARSIAGNQ